MMNLPNNGQMPDISNYLKFVYLVDGEVAHIVRVPPEAEMMIAIYQSKPVILQVDPTDDVQFGYRYEDGKFFRPSDGG
jgi:uncharacterized membrane protein (UPF0127 family)